MKDLKEIVRTEVKDNKTLIIFKSDISNGYHIAIWDGTETDALTKYAPHLPFNYRSTACYGKEVNEHLLNKFNSMLNNTHLENWKNVK